MIFEVQELRKHTKHHYCGPGTNSRIDVTFPGESCCLTSEELTRYADFLYLIAAHHNKERNRAVVDKILEGVNNVYAPEMIKKLKHAIVHLMAKKIKKEMEASWQLELEQFLDYINIAEWLIAKGYKFDF